MGGGDKCVWHANAIDQELYELDEADLSVVRGPVSSPTFPAPFGMGGK